MNTLLAPAMALLGRLPYSRKFLLTGAVLLLPLLYLLWAMLAPLAATVTRVERMTEGARAIQAMQPLVMAVQRHRGLSNAMLSGDAGARPRVEQAGRDVATAFEDARAPLASAGDRFGLGERLDGLRGRWRELESALPSLTAEASFEAHSALVAEVARTMDMVADQAGLDMNAEAASRHLQDALTGQIQPLIEALGQARGLTAGVLARRAISDAEKIAIALLMGRVQVHVEQMSTDVRKAIEARPELAAELEAPLAESVDSVQAFQGLTAINSVRENFILDSQSYFAEATKPLDKAVILTAAATDALNRIMAEQRTHALGVLWLTGAGVAALLALALYLGLAMWRAIARDVAIIERGASALAAGDLTQAVRVDTRDEMGRIGIAFERARVAIAGLVDSAAGAAGRVSAMAGGVADNAGCCSGAANRQSEAVSASAAAVEQMAVASAHIADQTHEADRLARQAGEHAQAGESAVAVVSREIDAVAESVRESASQIEGLNARAVEISGIVQVIRDIADQTNLLALNAAIEAARAGEQGRGFAVVADEVRKLAERTAKATTEIADVIGAVRTESADAVARMEVSRQRAVDGVASVERATSVLADIRAAMTGVLARVAEIANASSEQKAASNEIAGNVEHIARMTESNGATAAEVASQATRMGEQVAALMTELRRFNTRPVAVGASSADPVARVAGVAGVAPVAPALAAA